MRKLKPVQNFLLTAAELYISLNQIYPCILCNRYKAVGTVFIIQDYIYFQKGTKAEKIIDLQLGRVPHVQLYNYNPGADGSENAKCMC